MFNENQQEKIKEFATLTKLTNHCFEMCVSLIDNDINVKVNMNSYKLNLIEIKCLEKCSETYIDMHSNYNKFLLDAEEKYLNSEFKKDRIYKK